MKPLTAPPGWKILSERFYLKNGARYGKKSMTKLFSIIDLLKKNLAQQNDTIE